MPSGSEFEEHVYRFICKQVKHGVLPAGKVIRGAVYGGRKTDVSLEVPYENSERPFVVIIWECRCRSRALNKAQVSDFRTLLTEAGNAKGIFATTGGLQSGARELCSKWEIGHWKFDLDDWPDGEPKKVTELQDRSCLLPFDILLLLAATIVTYWRIAICVLVIALAAWGIWEALS